MKVAVWGAGEIGAGVAYRLTTCSFVSRLVWINRSYDNIASRAVDLEHGLALTPTCRQVEAVKESDTEAVKEGLADTQLLVVTQGQGVGEGKTRDDLLEANREVLARMVESIRTYDGVVLVVTNPVDALAWIVQRASGLAAARVIGLGTVVETARLRAAVAQNLIPSPPARHVSCYAIGTHDERTRLVIARDLPLHSRVREAIRTEVIQAPRRVKKDNRSTLHPVVEGVVTVARAVGHDSGEVLTVSARDEASGLYFSIPVSVGRAGVLERHAREIAAGDLEACRQAARELQH